MEIIAVIVLGLISLLFKKFGDQQEETPPRQRPVSPNQQSRQPKRLDDYARKLFEEFQEPQRRSPEPIRTIEVKQPARQELTMEPVTENVPVETSTSRRATVRVKEAKRTVKSTSILPKNEQELLQGFIFSEVIGPPKSKR
ncbi:hypothetical protein ACFOZY_11685 [Chungangia koreensis]|uniref:Cell division protein ZipA n=1 Tax=Chungangia koreensis TaxID=752657 RepID=A0ABV8X7F5_9LACT